VSKIIETTYHDTIEKLTSFNDSLVNNSFYTLNDRRPTIVTYYNINKNYSSLDPGSKLSYDNIGKNTSIRFNKIEDFMIYGFNRVELQTEYEEFGLEADKVGGDAVILPNTIIPTEGDYFEINYVKDSTWLFIVTDVQMDTLHNGSNAYKISYKLEYVDDTRIQEQVVETFKMIEKREGTNIVRIVRSEDLAVAKQLDEAAVTLKDYFNELFYNDKVQTYTYMDLTEWRMYDPYMIEFLIRNKILDNGSESFIYVDHKLLVSKTFNLEYDKSFYRAFEKKDVNLLINSNRRYVPENIKSFGTTFSSRYESYFKTNYIISPVDYACTCFPDEMVYNIQDHKLIDNIEDLNEKIPLWQNIIVKYFYDDNLTVEEVNSIYDINYDQSIQAFYTIPLLIFCLESYIEKALG
jgi:hypothetical protein